MHLKYKGDNFFYIVNSFLIFYIHVDKLYTFSMEILKINTELQQAWLLLISQENKTIDASRS